MPLKQPLDKLCWDWALETEWENVTLDHVKTAYRLTLPPCQLGKCRRHCKGNPYCVNCIGERVWFNDVDDTAWHDIQDPEAERRKPGMSVGLKNLGATCYVNTFLQLWYHNDTVKQGIFEWQDNTVGGDEDWKPTSVCAHLQVIFGLLEKSIRRYVDPSDFIQHLGLDAGQQQDAQEFSKLFLSVLEQNLAETPTKRNVIKEQFCGSYAYVTRCNHCKGASERMSEFYELDLNIQGHKTLMEALKGFLEVEKLEGDNKYMCSKCNEKQDATRAIELKELPPVLNLQLLRFVYDIKTGSKKKLNSIIQFPEVLDMGEHLGGGKCVVYELSAVLIHRGPSAYSGHYVAHIRDRDSQGWYKFNDEEIEKIKGKSLQLGNEEDLETKQKKVGKTPKGFVSSRNAYMLVYTKRSEISGKVTIGNGKETINNDLTQVSSSMDSNMLQPGTSKSEPCHSGVENNVVQSSMSVPNIMNNVVNMNSTGISNTNNEATPVPDLVYSIPDYISKYVEIDNASFESWVDEMNEMKAGNIARGREKQETVKAIFQELPYCPDDEDQFEWLPLSWVTKWLNDPSTSPAINLSGFMCHHGKVGLEQSTKMKCVSQKGSDQLFNLYGGEERLRGIQSLCMDCVQNRCKQIRIKKNIVEDNNFILAALKKNFDEENYFWIGKGSFRSWRRLALERLLEDTTGSKVEQSGTNNGDSIDDAMKHTNECNNSVNETSPPPPESNGNGDQTDYKEGTNGPVGTTEIEDYKENRQDVNSRDVDKPGINDDEETLQFNEDLLCDDHKGLEPDMSCRRVVPESVWYRIKQYFQGCPEFNILDPLCQQCVSALEAEHEDKVINKQIAATQKAALTDLFYDRKRPVSVALGVEVFVVSSSFVERWRTFIRDPVKHETLSLLRNSPLLCEHGEFLYPPLQDSLLKSDNKVTYVTKHEWAQLNEFFQTDTEINIICLAENDKKEIITFPKVCDDCLQNRLELEEREIFDYANELIYIRKNTKNEKGAKLPDPLPENVDDPDFSAGTARKRSLSEDAGSIEPPEKLKKVTDAGKIVRKSQRHRRVRGEKELTVSSSETLKHLKIKIMKLFSVPPFDQNLYVNGILLSNNDLTLGELKVAPCSVINLIADEAEEDPTFLEDISKHLDVPESGFKGTNLLGSTVPSTPN